MYTSYPAHECVLNHTWYKILKQYIVKLFLLQLSLIAVLLTYACDTVALKDLFKHKC